MVCGDVSSEREKSRDGSLLFCSVEGRRLEERTGEVKFWGELADWGETVVERRKKCWWPASF